MIKAIRLWIEPDKSWHQKLIKCPHMPPDADLDMKNSLRPPGSHLSQHWPASYGHHALGWHCSSFGCLLAYRTNCETLTIQLLRNEFNFWNVHGIMNTSGLVQSKWSPKGFTLTLQETRSIHDSMNIPKIEFITYIYILYYQSSINFLFLTNLAGFPDILNYIRLNVGFGIAKTPNFRA